MPVVINDFEVVPSPASEIKAPARESNGNGAEQPPPTDHEVKKMLERCAERLERVSAN